MENSVEKNTRFVNDLTLSYNNLLEANDRQFIWGEQDLLGSVSESGEST
ncbi:MAG: hypothetical protein LBN26_09245 [Christensenellaceae bacterium]|nr:hypothetical protein [Christensenellaceae bacterium]